MVIARMEKFGWKGIGAIAYVERDGVLMREMGWEVGEVAVVDA